MNIHIFLLINSVARINCVTLHYQQFLLHKYPNVFIYEELKD